MIKRNNMAMQEKKSSALVLPLTPEMRFIRSANTELARMNYSASGPHEHYESKDRGIVLDLIGQWLEIVIANGIIPVQEGHSTELKYVSSTKFLLAHRALAETISKLLRIFEYITKDDERTAIWLINKRFSMGEDSLIRRVFPDEKHITLIELAPGDYLAKILEISPEGKIWVLALMAGGHFYPNRYCRG